MKIVDLTIPLGVATPPWPTYEPLQVKYFKRLAPNGANGQVLTHSNHVGTHLDGEIHFYTPGKDIASLDVHFGWDQPTADEIRYMARHPDPTVTLPSGRRTSRSAGSVSTAAAPTIL
jgi:Putative cyclase